MGATSSPRQSGLQTPTIPPGTRTRRISVKARWGVAGCSIRAVAEHAIKCVFGERQGITAGLLRGLFHHIAARFEQVSFDRSCAAGAAALDLDGSLPGVQEAVAVALLAWQQVIADHLPMKTSARRLSFAGVVLSTIEGAYVRGRAERSAAPFYEAGDWYAEMPNKGLI